MRVFGCLASLALLAVGEGCVRTAAPIATCVEAVPVTPRVNRQDEVYVIPESITFGDGRLLVLGPPVEAIRRSGPGDPAIQMKPDAGIVMDAHGLGVLVPALDRLPPPVFASVAYQRGRGWNVVWAALDSAARGQADGTVFFARFDGERWRDQQQIGDFGRLVAPDAKSALVAWDSGFAIAFGALRPSREGDVTILVSDAHGWRSRVIPGPRNALYVALAVRSSRWVVAYAGSDSLGYPSLYTVSSSDAGVTWSDPAVVYHGNAYQPRLVAGSTGFDLYWLGERSGLDMRGLHIARSDSAGQHWVEASANEGIRLDSAIAFSVQATSDSTSVVVLRAQDDGAFLEQMVLMGPSGLSLIRSRASAPIGQAITVDRDMVYTVSAFADTFSLGVVPRLELRRSTATCTSPRR